MFSSFLPDRARKPGKTGTLPMHLPTEGREGQSVWTTIVVLNNNFLEISKYSCQNNYSHCSSWASFRETNSESSSNTGVWGEKFVVLLLCAYCSRNKYCLYLDCMFRKIQSLLRVGFLKLQHFQLSHQVGVVHSQTFTIRYINKGRFVKYEILP